MRSAISNPEERPAAASGSDGPAPAAGAAAVPPTPETELNGAAAGDVGLRTVADPAAGTAAGVAAAGAIAGAVAGAVAGAATGVVTGAVVNAGWTTVGVCVGAAVVAGATAGFGGGRLETDPKDWASTDPAGARTTSAATNGAREACALDIARDSIVSRGARPVEPFSVQPHFESPQFRQVMQPSIMTTAAVLHLVQSWAPCG